MPDLVIGADGLSRPIWAESSELMRIYYDTEWGVPVRDERGVYERLVLEGFQSGLSWATILRKRPAFRTAFADFVPDQVADFNEADISRLLSDVGIVRNRAKIMAAITNARATLALRESGGLHNLVWSFQPRTTPLPISQSDVPTTSSESIALSRGLKRREFSFVGPTTMFALMEAIGVIDTHLLGSHRRGCSGQWTADGHRLTDI